MYDPCIPEALKMFEDMTTRHKRELYFSRLIWKEIEREGKNGKMELIQLVPMLEMEFKF
jgi:hypothetical protein